MIVELSDEIRERAAVVAEARKWIKTPYHHGARVLGAGCDCAQLLIAAFHGADLIPDIQAGTYSHDWHMHKDEERYLAYVEKHTRRVDHLELSLRDRGPFFSASAGDILMWRHGRTYSHSAIVTRWPNIIHAYFPSRQVEEVSCINTPMARKPMRVYSFWRAS